MSREGDVVLIYFQDKPSVFARIEIIEPDIKKDWYQVTLQFLTIPIQEVTWILREEYINGTPFTMGGNLMKLEQVKRISVSEKPKQTGTLSGQENIRKTAKVIPFRSEND